MADNDSPIKIRARVTTTIDMLEKEVTNRNPRAARALVETLKTELQNSAGPALEAGALQALLGSLNYMWKDIVITESVFQAVLTLGKRVVISSNSSLSAATLARLDGILLLVKVAGEYKSNIKVRASIVSILRLFAGDENGARLVLWAGGVPLLLESIEASTDRLLLISACAALVSINVFHLGARSSTSKGALQLLQACRRFKFDAEVLEQLMTCLCLVSQSKTGALALLTVTPTTKPSSNAFSEACAVALDILKLWDSAPTNGISTMASTTNPTNDLSLPVISTERRSCAWAMMLLHNLALFGDQVLRSDLFIGFDSLDPSRRDLGARILERLRLMIEDSSIPSTSNTPIISATPPQQLSYTLVLRAAGVDGSNNSNYNEGEDEEMPCFAVLFSLEYLKIGYEVFLNDTHHLLESKLLQAKRGSLPVTSPIARLFCTAHLMMSHPLLKRGFINNQTALLAARNLIELIKSQDPPEYFKLIARSLDSCLTATMSGPEILPFRRFPLLVPPTTSTPPQSPLKPPKPTSLARSTPKTPVSFVASPVSPVQTPNAVSTTPIQQEQHQDGNEGGIWDWSSTPEEFVRQLTLRMERLFMAIDARLVYTNTDSLPITKLLLFHTDLIQVFLLRILSRPTPLARADTIELFIKMAAYAASPLVSNLDLTMAVLETLSKPSIVRLACSWRLVSKFEADRLDEMYRLTNFDSVVNKEEGLANPPSILRCPSVPFLQGCLKAMKPITLDDLKDHYRTLSGWLPLLGRNGDWYARPHSFVLDANFQVYLNKLQQEDLFNNNNMPNFDQLSLHIEPEWAQTQLIVECESRVQGLVEKILFSDDLSLKEVQVLKQFRMKPVDTITSEHAGKVARDITLLLVDRKLQFLEETGVRTALHWEKFTRRIKETTEMIVLAGCQARLLLQAMDVHSNKEMELGIRIAALKKATEEEQKKFFGTRFVEKNKWQRAICSLRATNLAQTPSIMVDGLLQVKDDIFNEAKELEMAEMSADDFLPIFALVVTRAQLISPWARCEMVQEFLGRDVVDQGEAGYYFVSFSMALGLIMTYKNV